MKTDELKSLRDLLRFLGESKAKLLLETLPDIEANIHDIQSVHSRFTLDIRRVLHELNLSSFSTESFDIRALLGYQENIEMRWRKNSYLLSPSSTSHDYKKDTHEDLDIKSYLAMLEARHIAATPWLSEILQSKRLLTNGGYDFGFDLGGGSGIALRLLKENGIIKKATLVDRSEIITTVFQMPQYFEGIDNAFIGDLTDPEIWEKIKANASDNSLLILSDVLHGRNPEDRKIILEFLSDQKGTKIIREFLGFSELDHILFRIQLKLFTNGDLLTLHQLRNELNDIDLYFQLLYNTPYYYVGTVQKC